MLALDVLGLLQRFLLLLVLFFVLLFFVLFLFLCIVLFLLLFLFAFVLLVLLLLLPQHLLLKDLAQALELDALAKSLLKLENEVVVLAVLALLLFLAATIELLLQRVELLLDHLAECEAKRLLILLLPLLLALYKLRL